MKINKLRTFGVGMLIAAFALLQFGCEQDWQKEFEPSVLKAPATVQLAVSNIEDYTAILTYTQSAVGQFYIAIVPGDDETPAPAENSLLKLTVPNAVFTRQIFISTEVSTEGVTPENLTNYLMTHKVLSDTLNIIKLVQNTSYKVFVLPVNADGVFGEVTSTPAFTTSDNFNPVLEKTTPAASGTADKPADFEVVVSFDEPIVINDADQIFFTYRNAAGVEEPHPAELTVEGKNLTAKQTIVPIAGQYVFLSIGANAIKDRSDNFYPGIASGVVAGYLEGLYWRVAYVPEKVVSLTPDVEEAVGDVNFVIKLTYTLPMAFNTASGGGYNSKNVKVRYTSVGSTLDLEVPQANISFAGNVVTIIPPRTPVMGETVAINIAEGAYRTVFSSPCEATAFTKYSWFVANRDFILGSYVANCVSAFAPNPVYNFNVTITADPASDDGVIITGLENSTEGILGTFKRDSLIIASEQSLGDLEGNGNSEVLIIDFDGEGVDIVGTINSNGVINISWGSYISGGPNNNYFWDRYANSIWTKAKGNTVNYVERQYKPFMKIK
ncbi:MAG: hypothetical protein RBR68_09430 [Tenuifilaceae bacterium]|nr:hypothetical protein [Tenuifilaceae bacterium]